MKDISVINFTNLDKAFRFLERQLNLLHNLGDYLIYEYGFKTFTRNLSRCQIWKLAHELPPSNEWREDSFDQARSLLKNKYGVSSNELSKAINLIKAHYEFAPLIGRYPPLLGVDTRCIISFLDHCVRLNKIEPEVLEMPLEEDSFAFEASQKHFKCRKKLIMRAWKKLKLSPEILAGLRALFYFARELNFSEQYILNYRHELENAQVAFKQSENEVWLSFYHILTKTNAAHNILKSLYFLKKTDFADKIVQRYGLEEKLPWLDNARNYQLFEKPDYFGYAI